MIDVDPDVFAILCAALLIALWVGLAALLRSRGRSSSSRLRDRKF